MMTSSNEDIFRVTGPLCGEFTGLGEFPTQRPVTRSFDVFFDLPLNKRLSKQPWGWWFETPSWSLWRQCNGRGTSPPVLLRGVHQCLHLKLWYLWIEKCMEIGARVENASGQITSTTSTTGGRWKLNIVHNNWIIGLDIDLLPSCH